MSVIISDSGRRAIVAIPGLAADQFDGGSIGQHAMFGSTPAAEDVANVEAWKAAKTRRVGKGSQRIVECDDDMLDELEAAFDALAISCSQGEEPAAAAACSVAYARVVQARRMLAAAQS